MRNINEVLAEKQREMFELKRQIDALLIVAPLVNEQGDQPVQPPMPEGTKRWP